jgi:hypothetical protein
MATAANVWTDLDDDARSRARRFHVCRRLLIAAAWPRATLAYLRLRRRSPAAIRWLRACGMSPWRVVYGVAAGRLLRRVLFLTGRTLRPVVVWPALPAGCVVAFFHTPWDFVLATEACGRQLCLIRTGPTWARRLGQRHVAWDRAGLKSLVRRVAAGARCAAAADTFVGGGDAGFLGTRHGLNPAAIRLAAAAGVPLVTLWPVYEHGALRLELGAPIRAKTCAEQPHEALCAAREFFEAAVRRDPAAWPRLVDFLEKALGAA